LEERQTIVGAASFVRGRNIYLFTVPELGQPAIFISRILHNDTTSRAEDYVIERLD